jgi:hypothetical protein
MQRYTVYSYPETALHVSVGTSSHHQEHIQLYLQHLVFVTPLLLSAAIVEELELILVCCGWRTPPTAHSRDELNESVAFFMISVATSKKILKEDEQNMPYYQGHDTLTFCSSVSRTATHTTVEFNFRTHGKKSETRRPRGRPRHKW